MKKDVYGQTVSSLKSQQDATALLCHKEHYNHQKGVSGVTSWPKIAQNYAQPFSQFVLTNDHMELKKYFPYKGVSYLSFTTVFEVKWPKCFIFPFFEICVW